MYKLDDKIDLNVNKDYYKELMNKFSDDENKINFLEERYSRLERLERENLTTDSSASTTADSSFEQDTPATASAHNATNK